MGRGDSRWISGGVARLADVDRQMRSVEIEAVSDELNGAVIESMTMGRGGMHIQLKDGRFIVFPDAEIVALFPAELESVH